MIGKKMNRCILQLSAIIFVCINVFGMRASAAAPAANMTFQFINDTERTLSMKLFSRSESHQEWPSKTKAYTIKPDAAVQQLKISCEEGEQVCWGAWMTVQQISGEVGTAGQRNTRTIKYSAGAGERGVHPCKSCCHVCTDGALLKVRKINEHDDAAK
jgi:hypothetical protein